MTKRFLSVFTIITFTWLFCHAANAWIFQQEGPYVDAYFTGDISIKRVYKWGPGYHPNRKVFDHIEPAKMTAKASSTYKTKGRGVSGASIKATVTGVPGGIVFRAFEQDVGPYISTKEAANVQNWVETSAENEVSFTVDTTKTIYINASGTGAAAKFVGGGGMGITMAILGGASVSYSDGTTITIPAPSISKNVSWTLVYTDKLPDGAYCDSSEGCNLFLPRANYHSRICPSMLYVEESDIRYNLNGNPCITSYYTCETSTCPNYGNHKVVGVCGHSYPKSKASEHTQGTPPCGDDTHAGYLCNISSDHKTTINCPINDAGEYCDYGSYYPCSPHQHTNPNTVGSGSNPGDNGDSTPTTASQDCPRCEEANSVTTSERHNERTCSRRRWVRKRVNGRWKNVRIGCGSNDDPATFSLCNNPRTCFNGWQHRD